MLEGNVCYHARPAMLNTHVCTNYMCRHRVQTEAAELVGHMLLAQTRQQLINDH